MPSAYTFLMPSACFHLSCTFFLVFMLVTSSILPPPYLYAFAYSCSPFFYAYLIIHVDHFIHAFAHFTLITPVMPLGLTLFNYAFTPVILVILFFICALIFLSSSYDIQLVHSIHALAHLINFIPAHHFITVFATLSCLHTPHVHCLFMLVISSLPSYYSGNSYFLSLYAH